mgnify:CR=1 FL=1
MGKKQTYDLGDGTFTMPATETIDEALDRLARQDARLNPGGHFRTSDTPDSPITPSGAIAALRGRTVPTNRLRPAARPPQLPPGWGSSSPSSTPASGGLKGATSLPATTTRPGRDVGLTIVRWIIVLAVGWFVLRFFFRAF